MFNNEVPNSGSQILSPKVRNFIFNHEVPKSGNQILSPKDSNFIFNNEVPTSFLFYLYVSHL